MSDFYRNQPTPGDSFLPPDQGAGADPQAQELYGAPLGSYAPEGDPFGPGADPFAAYDDPSAPMPEGGDEFAAWRRPSGGGFLTDDPMPFGAELQQGGVPLFTSAQDADASFREQGDSAPTRIARPVVAAQKVSKRTTVERAAQTAFAPPPQSGGQPETDADALPEAAVNARPADAQSNGGEAPVRRRRRMDRRAAETAGQQTMPAEADEQPVFDPFQAGDTEMPQAASAAARPERRAATPGGRYTGPRTAMPSGGVQARPGRSASERARVAPASFSGPSEPAVDELPPREQRPVPTQPRRQVPPQGQRPGAQRPAAQGQRPPAGRAPASQGQRPPAARAPQGQRPSPQGQRPAGQRPVPPQGAPLGAQGYAQSAGVPVRRQLPEAAVSGRPAYRGGPPLPRDEDPDEFNPHASVKRKRYEFEDDEEDEPARGHGALIPILAVLLVVGVLLAGICLPDWQGMGGGLGTAMGSVKSSVMSVFSSVKNMIAPEEEPVKSFTAAAAEAFAPSAVMFTVQTSKTVAGIRIADDNGRTVYNRAYSPDDLSLAGEVIENSNALIWKPSFTMEDAYTGGFTVYAQKQDGAESEGVRSDHTLTIDAPRPVAPPVQSFSLDPAEGVVPTRLTFTLTTSAEVAAVRIADQYNAPVVTLYAAESGGESGVMTDRGDTREWTLYADVDSPYAGDYTAQYQTDNGDLNFTSSDYTASVELTSGEQEPDVGDENDPSPTEGAEPSSDDSGLTGVAAPASTDQPIIPATPVPTATPEPTATPQPTSTPLPSLTAEASETAAPDAIKLTATLYQDGKTAKSYSRTKTISMLNPFTTYEGGSDYAVWKQAGVLTFRSGPFRQNASYGTVEVEKKALSQLWSQPVGSMKVNKATLYGIGAPGQAVIVKWPTEVRQRMGISDEMKKVTALKEVIVAGQDGNLYFYNLLDGTATRDPLKLGAPSAGGLSVATNGTPILGVGQSHSRLASKTVKNGYHIINLLTNEKLRLIECDGKDKNSNYTGATGAALFDSASGAMIFGSQNGVLYVAELGPQKEVYDYQTGKLALGTSRQGYKTLAAKQEKKNTNIDASVAMYDHYVYYADQSGIVQCVDVNTLQPVWAVNTGDNVDATPALDMEDGQTLALYTGNTILNQGKSGVCTIRRLNALTGEEDWSYEAPELAYTTEYPVGCEASPVVGQQSIDDLVIFTLSKGKDGSEVIAFHKQNGSVAWQTQLESNTVSSPVAVYNKDGDAWIIQAESDGSVHLMDGKTGDILNTLKLEGEIEASPAVYGNLLIIGTTGKNTGAVYCIKIE